jgi:hypothetical protein
LINKKIKKKEKLNKNKNKIKLFIKTKIKINLFYFKSTFYLLQNISRIKTLFKDPAMLEML